jgi:hypothetical protein
MDTRRSYAWNVRGRSQSVGMIPVIPKRFCERVMDGVGDPNEQINQSYDVRNESARYRRIVQHIGSDDIKQTAADTNASGKQ